MKKFALIIVGLLFFYAAGINAATLRASVGYEACLCSLGANAITKEMRKITLVQAKALVMATLTPEGRRLPGLQFDTGDDDPNKISTYEDSRNPRFLTFMLVWANDIGGSVIAGHYSVDSYTGDVFDSSAECAEYYSRKLDALQKKIRRSLHLTESEYRKLKTNGPECVGDTDAKKKREGKM